MKLPREPRRRPIADFLFFAREQPNAAFAWGVAVVAVIALGVFGVVRYANGSSHTSAKAGADANAGDPGGQALDGSNAGGGGSSSGGGSSKTGGSGTSAPGRSSTATTAPSGGPGSHPTKGHTPTTRHSGSGSNTTPTLFVPTPPTTDRGPLLPLKASEQRWVTSPSNIHMKGGAFARGNIIVANLTDHWGTVTSPGCSGPPVTTPGPAAPSCKAGKAYVVQGGRSQKWMWTWHATWTGRAGAPPLAPGSYFFSIGPVNVHVTVK